MMRLLVVEDELLVREGLVHLLGEEGFDVVGVAGTADDAVRKASALHPDVALLDIRMPPTHSDEGLQVAETLNERHPEIGVLVLSHHVESEYALRLLEMRTAGIGYVLKQRVSQIDVLASAIRRVGNGHAAVDPQVVESALGRSRRDDPLGTLTERERDLLGLMAQGLSNIGIGHQLYLSNKTIESHVRSIFRKLDIPIAEDDNRRVLAVLKYLQAS